MSTIRESLAKLKVVDGYVAAALVDSDSGMVLGSDGNGTIDLDLAAAANTEVVRAKRKAITVLGLNDSIEDILITLGKAYHLIRPMRERPTAFFYLVLDRRNANLAFARMALADAEKGLTF